MKPGIAKWLKVAVSGAVGLLTAAALVSLARTPRAPKHRAEDLLRSNERIAVQGVREPSGVAFDPRRGHLFVVGDEGSLVEITVAGSVVRSLPVEGDLEDVAVLPSGDLLLLSERTSELILYDPEAPTAHPRRGKKRWQLPQAVLLGVEPADRNSGFEGLAFKEDPRRPGQGTVFLTHQRWPAVVLVLAFDPTRPEGPIGADSVVARWPIHSAHGLSAITYVPSLDRLLVISDKTDRLLVLRPDGHLEAEIPLPGLQQEGLCFDGKGDLWVADDRGGALLRFPGALERLSGLVNKPGI